MQGGGLLATPLLEDHQACVVLAFQFWAIFESKFKVWIPRFWDEVVLNIYLAIHLCRVVVCWLLLFWRVIRFVCFLHFNFWATFWANFVKHNACPPLKLPTPRVFHACAARCWTLVAGKPCSAHACNKPEAKADGCTTSKITLPNKSRECNTNPFGVAIRT